MGFCNSNPAGPGSRPVAVTWSQLSALVTAGTLIRGRTYRITDFATLHNIPNTGGTQNIGATEVLQVRALSAGILSQWAVSESYPQDIIEYELVDTSSSGANKGRILYRKDMLLNMEAWQDWRNVKLARWESSAGSGVYTSLTDPGGGAAQALLYMFANSAAATGCQGISIGRKTSGDQIANIVVGATCQRIVIGINNTGTFGASCWNITMGDGNTNFILLGSIGTALSADSGRVAIGSLNVNLYIGTSNAIKSGAAATLKKGLLTIGDANNALTIPNNFVQNCSLLIGDKLDTYDFTGISPNLGAVTTSEFICTNTFSNIREDITIAGGTTTLTRGTDFKKCSGIIFITTSGAEAIANVDMAAHPCPITFKSVSNNITFQQNANLGLFNAANYLITGNSLDFITLQHDPNNGKRMQTAGGDYV